MVNFRILAFCSLLSSLSAFAATWTDGSTANGPLSIRGIKDYVDVHANESGRSLRDIGVNGYVTVESDHYVVHLEGGAGLCGMRCNAAGIEIRLAGDNTMSNFEQYQVNGIQSNKGVKITGAGTLAINNASCDQASIYAGGVGYGELIICNGAAVAVNSCRNDMTIDAIKAYDGFELRNAVLHVNHAARSTAAIGVSEGTASIRSSVLTVISAGKCFSNSTYGGTVSALLSNIHLSSTRETALLASQVQITDCVVTLDGADCGFSGGSIAFDNVVGCVSGRGIGIDASENVSIGGGATDLAIIGNLAGENVCYPCAYAGQAIHAKDGAYRQKAGKVRLFSPRNEALYSHLCTVSGGTLAIGDSISYSDLRKTYTLSTAAAALEAGIGYSLYGKSWQFTDTLLATNIFTGAFNSTYALFATAKSKPEMGIEADSLAVSGGRVSVQASDVGISIDTLAVSGAATVTVAADNVGICNNYSKEKAYVDWYSSELCRATIGGGSLTVRGGRDGMLLCGEFRQTGGKVVLGVTTDGKAGKLNVWPWLTGYALSANLGLSRSGGTFAISKGLLRVKMKETSSASVGGAEKKTYNVAFKANGGKGKMAKQKFKRDTAAKLRKNAFKRKGYVFAGWAKKKKGAVAYVNAQRVKNIAAAGKTLTLYAVWAKKTYKIAFCANGGKGKMAKQKFTYGKAAKLRKNAFKRSGCNFKGWAKSAALAKRGKVAYKNKAVVKNLTRGGKTVKLYAVWMKKPKTEKIQETRDYYIVTFDANGGRCAPSSIKVRKGQPLQPSDLPAKVENDDPDFESFDGWYTHPMWGGQVKGPFTVSGDTTLYAQWKYKLVYNFHPYPSVPCAVTFDANGGQVAPGNSEYAASYTATQYYSQKCFIYRVGDAYDYSFLQVRREGYCFTGWYTAKSGGELLRDKTVFLEPATVWAHWKKWGDLMDDAKVHWDLNWKDPDDSQQVHTGSATPATGQGM